jgi:hypothetical protein
MTASARLESAAVSCAPIASAREACSRRRADSTAIPPPAMTTAARSQ